jgi:hypothetical protein
MGALKSAMDCGNGSWREQSFFTRVHFDYVQREADHGETDVRCRPTQPAEARRIIAKRQLRSCGK